MKKIRECWEVKLIKRTFEVYKSIKSNFGLPLHIYREHTGKDLEGYISGKVAVVFPEGNVRR